MFGRKREAADSGVQATEEQILRALSTVIEPELRRDLVTLKMVRDIQVQDGKVGFTIVLTTPACPLTAQIEREAQEAVQRIPGVKEVSIKWDANVPTDARITGRLSLPVKNTIAVSSGKGGVGKTTIAVNLAVALAHSGTRVGLLDADVYGPNVPLMLGIARMPPPRGSKLVPAESYDVKVMSMAFLVGPNQPLIWRGPMLHSAIRQMLMDTLWGELDYLVIDLPPGTGDAQLTLAQSVPLTGGLVVTTPQAVALLDAVRGLEMFNKLEVPVLGIVENMSWLETPTGERIDVFGQGGGERIANQYGVPLLGQIPLDPQIRVGGDAGKPMIISHPESTAGTALHKMAQAVAAQVSVINLSQGSSFISLTSIG